MTNEGRVWEWIKGAAIIAFAVFFILVPASLVFLQMIGVLKPH